MVKAHSVGQTIAEIRRAASCLRTMAGFCFPYRRRLLLLTVFRPLGSLPGLLTPLVMQLLIDRAYPDRDFVLLGWLCAALLVLGVLPSAAAVISDYLATYINNMMHYRLSLRIYNAVHRLPLSYLERHESGMFLERATRDVTSVAACATERVPQLVDIGFTFLIAVPLMMKLNAWISLIILVIVPINYMITMRMTRRLVTAWEAGRLISEKITTFTVETVQGATIARLFALDRSRRTRLKELLRDRLGNQLRLWRTNATWGQFAGLFNISCAMMLTCGGWYLVFTNRLQLGQAVALGMYLSICIRPFRQLGDLYQVLVTDSVAANRVLELLNVAEVRKTAGDQRAIVTPPETYELRGLSFGYQDRRLCLHDIDLKLRLGETVAVIGPTGGGKSTLLRVLCGLDDRYHGQFLVDGYEFHDVSGDSYLQHVSMVPQTSFFFSESIYDNLPGGRPHSSERLEKYGTLLGLNTVFNLTPDGFKTKLGCEGVRFSVGQYQKLAALRAMLKDASVLLLDEVTAAMDIESERKLLQGTIALRRPDCLTVLVTHHISITTEPWIDRIVVLMDGRIVEDGSCAELWQKRGFYHQWLSLSEEAVSSRATCVDELAERVH